MNERTVFVWQLDWDEDFDFTPNGSSYFPKKAEAKTFAKRRALGQIERFPGTTFTLCRVQITARGGIRAMVAKCLNGERWCSGQDAKEIGHIAENGRITWKKA